jgi:hypothetical protein
MSILSKSRTRSVARRAALAAMTMGLLVALSPFSGVVNAAVQVKCSGNGCNGTSPHATLCDQTSIRAPGTTLVHIWYGQVDALSANIG